MKILLIEPPSPHKFGTLRILGSLGSYKANMAWPPLDLMIISGFLNRNAISSEIIDANNLKIPFVQLKNMILRYNPKAVVFTTTIPTMDNDVLTAKIAKEFSPSIQTCAIGLSIESSRENILKKCPYLDIVVYSEPELPMLELIKANFNPAGIKGIYYRKGTEVIKNPPYPKCDNLDILGIPSHDKVPIRIYKDPLMKRWPMTVISASRGCINACNHCLSIFQKPLRYRSVDNVMEELKFIVDLGIKEVKFFDCALTNDEQWCKRLFNKMIKEGINLSWNCNARADYLSKETIALMKQAGCHTICLGTESANQAILDRMGKNTTINQTTEAAQNIKKANIRLLTYFVFGLIGETKQTMRESIAFAKRLDPDFATFGIAVPVYGTKFFDYLEKNDFLHQYDTSKHDPNNPPPYSYSKLCSDEIYQTALQGYREFYLRPKYIAKKIFTSPQELKNNFSNLLYFIKRYIFKK